ncbi:MAG: NAD(P)-dependent alcohol dehydrogenase [Chloroflexi bacterium]|nr:MAG: NAD(P)-dependent alcohol dehydrogenase [Chloroflexota bacterium]
MKAIVYEKYGLPDVLERKEIDKPVVAEDEVLVRIRASSVNPVDWYGMIGLYIARMGGGLRKPKDTRLGVDFAGVVEAVGGNVKQFRPGDEVYGGRSGAFAEYISIHEQRGIAPKPANLTFEQAAAVPVAALTALQGLRDHGQLQPGQKVLINGASGGVGTFAVQIARAFGAEVTGVCSTGNVDLVRSLGADHVIDYTREDFTRSGRRYDLFLDIAGSRSWSECKRVLNPRAIFVIVGGPKANRWIGPLSHVIKLRLAALRASQKVVFFIANLNKEDLVVMQELLEAGKVTPVIDKRYELSELPEAMRYLGEGHARGKVVITVENQGKQDLP